MDVRKQLDLVAEKYSQKEAIIFKDNKVSFSQLRENVLSLAAGLKAQGISGGDKIALYLPNSLEYVYSYLACFCLGAVGVPLDIMLKEEELLSCLDHSETKLLIAQNKPDLDFKKLASEVQSLETIVSLDGSIENSIAINEMLVTSFDDLPSESIDKKAPALIMYTSGTTGNPKGILLNYGHLNGSPEAMNHFVDLSDRDIKLATIPLSHIGGFIYIQNCIVFGITLVLMERFHPMEFLKNVAEYKVTCFHIVPPMYNAILTLKQIEKFDLSSLRWVVVFGAPSSPEILERFHKYCPNAKLLNGWGMTETCPPNTVTPMDSDNIASIGKPAPNCEIKIFNDLNQEVPTGQIGEIVIRGWVVMDGYYKDEKTTNELLRNGWLYTGDLGRYDENGFLYIVGRKKEMIKVGGQLVYAPEVESCFYKNDNVEQVAVISVSDKMKGEVIKAFVVLKEDSRLSESDLREFAREHLANFKVPKFIELRDDLPKNRTGKIDKELLKEKILV